VKTGGSVRFREKAAMEWLLSRGNARERGKMLRLGENT